MNTRFYLIATSTNQAILMAYKHFLCGQFKIKKCINLPNTLTKYTILKAPHIHKKSRDQYELKKCKQLFFFEAMSIQAFIKFKYLLTRNVPANMSIKIILATKNATE